MLIEGLLSTLNRGSVYLQTHIKASLQFFINLQQWFLGDRPFKFIYLFIVPVLGLCFCVRAFSSCGERGPLFIAVHWPLTITASVAVEHRLQMRRLSSCGSRAQLLRGMWDLPRPGLKPVFPALAGRFSTTAPPGKPETDHLKAATLKQKLPKIFYHKDFHHFILEKCFYSLSSWVKCSGTSMPCTMTIPNFPLKKVIRIPCLKCLTCCNGGIAVSFFLSVFSFCQGWGHGKETAIKT